MKMKIYFCPGSLNLAVPSCFRRLLYRQHCTTRRPFRGSEMLGFQGCNSLRFCFSVPVGLSGVPVCLTPVLTDMVSSSTMLPSAFFVLTVRTTKSPTIAPFSSFSHAVHTLGCQQQQQKQRGDPHHQHVKISGLFTSPLVRRSSINLLRIFQGNAYRVVWRLFLSHWSLVSLEDSTCREKP